MSGLLSRDQVLGGAVSTQSNCRAARPCRRQVAFRPKSKSLRRKVLENVEGRAGAGIAMRDGCKFCCLGSLALVKPTEHPAPGESLVTSAACAGGPSAP